MTIVTSREFNHDLGAAKRAAQNGPVIVTDDGEPAFVLLNISDYRRITEPNGGTLVDALRLDEDIDVDFPPMRLVPRIPDL